MIQESMTMEQIYDAKRNLNLLEKQLILKQNIEKQELLMSQNNKNSMSKYNEELERGKKYYEKYKETFDTIQLQKKYKDILEKQISSIEQEIRLKYYKLECDEIEEKTKELKKQLQSVKLEIKSTYLKPSECLHCDENEKYFLSYECKMCGATIRRGGN